VIVVALVGAELVETSFVDDVAAVVPDEPESGPGRKKLVLVPLWMIP